MMKKKLIYTLFLAAVISFLFYESDAIKFKRFVQKNDPILNLNDFLNDKKWSKVALVTPYDKFCLAGDCVTSSDDGEQFLVFIQNERITAHLDIGRYVTFAKWPYWITRELALFRKNPVNNIYEFSTPNSLDKDSILMKKFVLSSPNGNRPFCKLFLTGNANCFFETEKECDNHITDFDEVCVPNRPGVIKEMPYKWREIGPEKSS